MKLALILFAAQLLATRPEIVKGGVGAMVPVLTVVGAGVFVVGVESTWARRWSRASRSPRCSSAPGRGSATSACSPRAPPWSCCSRS